MGAPVTWFEINTGDANGVRGFYAILRMEPAGPR